MTLRQAASRLTVLAAGIAALAWFTASKRALHHQPGVLVARDPEQLALTDGPATVEKHGWKLQPLAEYRIEARVLGIARYRRDATSELSPVDLVLGWGRMSDESVLERLEISQSDRYYRWQYWGAAPIPEKEIMTHSANVHVIPANDAAAAVVNSLRVGELVRLEGYLVEATHPRADRPWRSSLARDDEGEGACELMLVESAIRIDAPR